MDTNLYIIEPDVLGDSKELDQILQAQRNASNSLYQIKNENIKLEKDLPIFGTNVNAAR